MSNDFDHYYKLAHLSMPQKRFKLIALLFGLVFAFAVFLIMFNISKTLELSLTIPIVFTLFSFVMVHKIISMIPQLMVTAKKTALEADLLYSARHLLLKLESGSSLLNAIDSVTSLHTKSSLYFRELMFDISMGTPLENAIEKAIEYSPSKAYARILQEIQDSLKTGADIQEALKSTLKDVTRQHLIQIKTYGKKLNPMSMFYMIIGTILPSIGTAMLVVGLSFVPGGGIEVNRTLLLGLAGGLFIVQFFFVLGFKALKPAVMN